MVNVEELILLLWVEKNLDQLEDLLCRKNKDLLNAMILETVLLKIWKNYDSLGILFFYNYFPGIFEFI